MGQPAKYLQEFVSNNTERNNLFNQLNVRMGYFKTLGPVNMIAFWGAANVLNTTPGCDRYILLSQWLKWGF
ncbi:hypothetical protein GCM10023333_14170 [Ferrimonas pelagia]|uniref:Uncharacterized protein n=1 Tax=Ferrimonas pelagia TaxID=1177826 RepID=A0ABP9EQ97_9GAMM